jgi:hypothetical protein
MEDKKRQDELAEQKRAAVRAGPADIQEMVERSRRKDSAPKARTKKDPED